MSELSSRSLTQALSEFVPRHWDNSSRRGSAEYIYPEEEIDQVSNILSVLDEEHRRWTHVPRLYIVLRRVGLTDFLNNFLQAGLNDYCFPFSESGLRHVLQSHHADAFLRVQSCVLSRHFQLERFKKNEHVYFATEEEIPFRQVGWLGSGGFSEVQKVVSTVDFKTYARKMIKRASLEGKIRHGWSDFERELNTLKKVKHYHTVQLVGSYTDPRFAAFIMSPVADCSLDQFMSFHTINDEKLSLIQGFFGCLMAALSYLHDQNIRHKDIKPKNILIKGGKALFTDFGLSLDCTDLTRSTTEGPTARTLRYCAPEVASSSPRNKSSDVWSLGCVFLEMMTMLKEKSVEDLRTFLEENGMESSLFWDNQPGVAQWIMLLRETPRGEMDNTPLIWIERMLSWDRMARPTGESLLAHIVPYGAASGQPGKFCGACCRFEYDITAPPVLSDGTMRQSREPPVGEGVVIRSVEVSVAPKLELSDITMRPSTSLSIPSLVLSNLDSTSQSMMDISIPESPTMKEPSISAPDVFHQRFSRLRLRQARYFMIKSNNEADIRASRAHNTWVSHRNVNTRLDKAFRQTGGSVVLMFSLSGSRRFSGVAELTSAYDPERTDSHWVEDRFTGRFDIEWLCQDEISFDLVQHLNQREDKEWSVTRLRDGNEICASSGREMLRMFSRAMGS